MSKGLFVKNSIVINGPAAKVWDAFVNPAKTKQYMFGCETVSDWKKGSSLLWKGEQEGKEIVWVKGDIVEIRPEKLLTYTTIDTQSNMDDTSKNYLEVTYELIPQNGGTLLNVIQGDYSSVAEGDRRCKEAYNNGEGWSPILAEIKKLVESENSLSLILMLNCHDKAKAK